MAKVGWRMKGPSFGTCNCAWGCPCQFNALPTYGNCTGLGAMRIDEGHFGDVGLDGLRWVITYSWPSAIHEGNGASQIIIDERADAGQRAALTTILRGGESEPGATLFHVFATTVTTVHEPIFAPIAFTFDLESRTARLTVPDVLDAVGEPIRNPVTGAEHRARVTLPHGFEYLEAEYGSGSANLRGAIKLDTENRYAQFHIMDITGDGPVN